MIPGVNSDLRIKARVGESRGMIVPPMKPFHLLSDISIPIVTMKIPIKTEEQRNTDDNCIMNHVGRWHLNVQSTHSTCDQDTEYKRRKCWEMRGEGQRE